MLVLLALVVSGIVTDSLVTIVILNRIARLKQDVCNIHTQVHAWEDIVSRKFPHGSIPPPLLGEPPDCLPPR
jgi:hypothetical protein